MHAGFSFYFKKMCPIFKTLIIYHNVTISQFPRAFLTYFHKYIKFSFHISAESLVFGGYECRQWKLPAHYTI